MSGRETVTVTENPDEELVLATYTAADVKTSAPVEPRWSLSGRDGGDFTINELGQLTFRNTPDYDRPADSNRDNEYLVIVRAYDGRYYGSLNVTVTANDLKRMGRLSRAGRPSRSGRTPPRPFTPIGPGTWTWGQRSIGV